MSKALHIEVIITQEDGIYKISGNNVDDVLELAKLSIHPEITLNRIKQIEKQLDEEDKKKKSVNKKIYDDKCWYGDKCKFNKTPNGCKFSH